MSACKFVFKLHGGVGGGWGTWGLNVPQPQNTCDFLSC